MTRMEHIGLPQAWDRRTFLKTSGLTVAGASLAPLLAACGGDGAAGSGGTLTLRMPFLLDMQVPDPDIMYEGEGLQVMLAVYEGLVNYEPGGSSKIIPALAESWTVSADLLTYTFKLRPNVKFHDGTAADAESWAKSFKRRTAVDQGPAYMVAGVASTETPDATTFIVHLKQPNDAFLDYLACPWQPYAVSPTAVAAHTVGSDLAQEWLKTHDAGTGPFMIKEFVPGSRYTLEAFDGYWGPAPAFKQIVIEITPDITTQKLKLDEGSYDLVTKGFAIENVLAYQKNPKFKVINTPGASISALWLNATGGKFTDLTLRRALLQAVDRQALIGPVYQGLVEVEKNYFAEDMFPDGMAPYTIPYDPSILAGLVKTMPSKKVDLAYAQSYGAPYARMAELLQTQLQKVGLDVTVRGMPSSQLFALAKGPAAQRPDLLLWTYGGDALHVDTVLRIFLRTGAAPLNWAQYSNKELDSLMDLAIIQPTKQKVNEEYVKIAKIIQDQAWVLPFGRAPYSTIAHSSITDIFQNSYYPPVFDTDKIKKV